MSYNDLCDSSTIKSWLKVGAQSIACGSGNLNMNNNNIVSANNIQCVTINGNAPSAMSGNDIIWSQGNPSPSGNIVSSFSSVAASIASLNGAVNVYIDNTYAQCIITSSVNCRGKTVFLNSNVQASNVLQVADGVTVTDLGGLVDIAFQNISTITSPLVFDNILNVEALGSRFVNTSSASVPMVSVTNPSYNGAFIFRDFGLLDNSANESYPIFSVGSGCSLNIAIVNCPGFYATGANQITSVDNTAILYNVYDSAGAPYSSGSFTGTINNTALDQGQYISGVPSVPGSAGQVVYVGNSSNLDANSHFTYDGSGNVTASVSYTAGSAKLEDNGSALEILYDSSNIATLSQYNVDFNVPVMSDSFDAMAGQSLSIGATNATSISIGQTTSDLTIISGLTAEQNVTVDGTLLTPNIDYGSGVLSIAPSEATGVDIGFTGSAVTAINIGNSSSTLVSNSSNIMVDSSGDLTLGGYIDSNSSNLVLANSTATTVCIGGSTNYNCILGVNNIDTNPEFSPSNSNINICPNVGNQVTMGSSGNGVTLEVYGPVLAPNIDYSGTLEIGPSEATAIDIGFTGSDVTAINIGNSSATLVANSSNLSVDSTGDLTLGGSIDSSGTSLVIAPANANNIFLGATTHAPTLGVQHIDINTNLSLANLTLTLCQANGNAVHVGGISHSASLIGYGNCSLGNNSGSECDIANNSASTLGFYATAAVAQQNASNITPASYTGNPDSNVVYDSTTFTTASGQSYTIGQLCQALSSLGLLL